MAITVKQLGERLRLASNQDAVVVICADGVEYLEVTDLIDETQAARQRWSDRESTTY